MPRDDLKVTCITPRVFGGSELPAQAAIYLQFLISRCYDIVLQVNNAHWVLVRLGDNVSSVQVHIEVSRCLLPTSTDSRIGEGSDACHGGLGIAQKSTLVEE
jgi:hypothetical protein